MSEYDQYKAIADADPGGVLEAAFESMSTDVKYTKVLTGNDLRLWAAVHAEDYTKIKAAADSNVAAEICLKLFDEINSTIDLSKPQILGMLGEFKNAGILTNEGYSALLAMAEEPKFPGLTEQRLKNARDQRLKGVV